MTPRRALWWLIGGSTALRLAWAAGLGPGNDEAYHYLFSVHRDWSYFDHPPMLAVVEMLGMTVAGGSSSTFGLRLGFIALFAGSTWLMAGLTSRFYGPRAGFLAAFALNVSAYYTAAAGVFALPDGPLLFFWLLTLDRLARALEAPRGHWPWAVAGLAWGCACLSKYHAIFLPVGAVLYLAIEPSARSWLLSPGPYLAVAIGLAVFSPVIGWNAAHGWASFAFQGGRALGPLQFRPGNLAMALLGQAAYLFPWMWGALAAVLLGGLRRAFKSDSRSADRFLLCQAVVPLTVFAAVACMRPVLPHWTLVGFLSLFPLLGRSWDDRWRVNPGRFRRRLAFLAALPVGVIVVLTVHGRTGLFQRGGNGSIGLVRVARDPSIDLYGWDQVALELKRRGLLDSPHTFLFTSHWYSSGQLAFATRGAPVPVLCYNKDDARSFAFWSRPGDWVGRDGILVALNDRSTEPQCYDSWFTRIEPIGSFEVIRAGTPVRKVRLFRCVRQVRPFPFDGFRSRALEPRVAQGGSRDDPAAMK